MGLQLKGEKLHKSTYNQSCRNTHEKPSNTNNKLFKQEYTYLAVSTNTTPHPFTITVDTLITSIRHCYTALPFYPTLHQVTYSFMLPSSASLDLLSVSHSEKVWLQFSPLRPAFTAFSFSSTMLELREKMGYKIL